MASEPGLCNLVMLVSQGVGKTALVLQFTTQHFSTEYNPTIMDSYREQFRMDGSLHTLEILDASGLDDYADLLDTWILTSNAFVLVYEISSRKSFQQIPRYYDKIQQFMRSASSSTQTPIVVVGNKCDNYTKREVSIKDGEALAQFLGCEFIETSAKEDINVGRIFSDILKNAS